VLIGSSSSARNRTHALLLGEEVFRPYPLVHLVNASENVSMIATFRKKSYGGTVSAGQPMNIGRKYRRFLLRYPVNVRFGLGNSVTELQAVSNNVSLGGILLQTDSAIPSHSNVSFTMIVRKHHIIGSTQIAGEGEVVRVQPHRSGAGFAIAVRCKRPISMLRRFLPTSVKLRMAQT
jgi:hypothetical protein